MKTDGVCLAHPAVFSFSDGILLYFQIFLLSSSLPKDFDTQKNIYKPCIPQEPSTDQILSLKCFYLVMNPNAVDVLKEKHSFSLPHLQEKEVNPHAIC